MHDIFFKLNRCLFVYAVAIAGGCYSFFILPVIPDMGAEWLRALLVTVSIIVIIGCYYVASSRFSLIRGVSLLSISLAILACLWTMDVMKNHQVTTLKQAVKHVDFQAKILAIETTSRGWRLLLAPVKIAHMRPDFLPEKIRVTTRNSPETFHLGQQIQGKAVLYPPHLPLTPHGFQSHRWAYLQGIGALGWVYDLTAQPGKMSETGAFAQFRWQILQKIETLAIETEAKSILMALLLGEKSAIPASVQTVFQQVGLSHLLAISGLHMGLVIGFSILLGRFCLQLLPSWITRYDTKMPAIFMGLICGIGYLMLSGMAPSALRAFIMCCLAGLAILAGRQILSIRTVSLTAILLLIFDPGLILNIGFQMSFIAVLGLVICMPYLQSRKANHFPLGRYIWIGMATSLVATLSTFPIILGHFQMGSLQAIFSNFCAVPLTAFLLLPSAFLGLCLIILEVIFSMSFGSQTFFLLTEQACHLLLFWADFIADLDLGIWQISELVPISFMLLVCALFIIFLGGVIGQYQRKISIFLVFVAAGCCLSLAAIAYQIWQKPDMQIWITSGHSYILIAESDQVQMLHGHPHRPAKGKDLKNYIQRQWNLAFGLSDISMITPSDLDSEIWHCQGGLCDLRYNIEKSTDITLVLHRSAIPKACTDRSNIIITLYRIRQSCPKPSHLIDALTLSQQGSHWIGITKGQKIFIKTASEIGQGRAWAAR